MTKCILVQACCLLIVFSAVYAQEPAKTLTEDEMVSRLQSGDFDQMDGVLARIRLAHTDGGYSALTLAPGSEVGPAVRSVLIDLLAYSVEQYGAWSDGKPYDKAYMANEPHEWNGILLDYVTALKDEASIPVLLQMTGFGPAANRALLDFGPMVLDPALACADDDTGWTGAVSGCLRFLGEALYLWRNQFSEDQLAHLGAIIRKYLSRPHTDYRKEYAGVRNVKQAAVLAMVLGWTDEFTALAHARLEEMDPEQYDWEYALIRDCLSGKRVEFFVDKYGAR